MKLIKFKKFKIIALTICNLTLFLFLYYHHRDYLSQGAIVCYGENCDQLKIDQSSTNIRNERSTPTEFILPSSTVVANRQEQKKNKK